MRFRSLDLASANATARRLTHRSILAVAHCLMQASAPVPGGNSTRFGHRDLALLAPHFCQTPPRNARCLQMGPDKSAARLSVSQQDNMGAYKGSADPRPSHRSFSSRLPVLSVGSGIGQKRSRPCHHDRRQLTSPRNSVFAS